MKSDQQRSHKAITATSTEASILSEATARPWHLEGQLSIYAGNYGIGEAWNLNDNPENFSNAALIVRAVNNHDALVKALEQALSALTLFRSLVNEGGVPRYDITPGAALNSVIEEDVDPTIRRINGLLNSVRGAS